MALDENASLCNVQSAFTEGGDSVLLICAVSLWSGTLEIRSFLPT